jgi:hypothetical protein
VDNVVYNKHHRDNAVMIEVLQSVGIPGIVGTPLLWKASICHYSVISAVFDYTNNAAYIVL